VGPFNPTISDCERRARLRSLHAISRLYLGQRGEALGQLLHCAETDATLLGRAAVKVDRLASLDRRKVLASYAGLSRFSAPCR
jgi:hypothetical protein